MPQANPGPQADLTERLAAPAEQAVPQLLEALLSLPADAAVRRGPVYSGAVSLMGRGAYLAAAQLLTAAPRRSRKEHLHVVRLCQEILLAKPRPEAAALETALGLIGHPLRNAAYRIALEMMPSAEFPDFRARLVESADASLAHAVAADAKLEAFVGFARDARSVSIVGNGPSLKGAGRGAEIDASDLVVRCNFPPIDGFGADVGMRTDAVVSFLNPASDQFEGYFTNSSAYAASCLLQMSSNFVRDYGQTPDAVLEIWKQLRYARVPVETIRTIEDMTYREPTTGFHAIMFFTVFLRKQVRLFGFDFFAGTGHHYWRKGGPRPPGVHNPGFERLYVQKCLIPLFGLQA